MNKKLNGFTLVEVLVGIGIISIAIMIWLGGLTPMFSLINRGKDRFDLAVEQRAMVTLLEAVSKSAVRGALCFDPNATIPDGYPHPYGKLRYDGVCETLKIWTTSEKTAWFDLADKVMGWQGASSGTALDSTYYTSQIVPAMSAAGCLKCHGSDILKTYDVNNAAVFTAPFFPASLSNVVMNTTRPDIANRDFNNYNHIVDDPFMVGGTAHKPLATRAILSSTLAEMFFRTQFEISRIIPGSSYLIKHNISFKIEKTSLSIPSFQAISKTANFCVPNGTNTAAACNPIPPVGLCDSAMGESYDGGSCSCNCTAWNPPPVCSCGKGCVMTCPGYTPTCATWETKYNCLSPSKIEVKTLFEEDGQQPTPANHISPAWETVADTYCATGLIAGNQCDGLVCGVGSPPSSACLEPNTCQRICTTRSWTAPTTCGKGCVVPPAPTSCIKQKVQLTCRYPLPSGVTETAILTYTLNSDLLDSSFNVISSLVTSGAIK